MQLCQLKWMHRYGHGAEVALILDLDRLRAEIDRELEGELMAKDEDADELPSRARVLAYR
jgi:hypothetical protein